MRSSVQVLAGASLAAAGARAYAGRKSVSLTSTDLGGGLTLLSGAGCNVVTMGGPEGALLVDGGLEAHSRELLKNVHAVTNSRRVHMLINTHWHPEQTGSNEAVGRSGAAIFSHEKTRLWLSRASTVTGAEGSYGPLAEKGRPNKTTYADGTLEFAGRQVDYGYLPQAHTDGDLYVHFREADVLVAGGPVAGNGWPVLDFRNGAWIGGVMRAFEKLDTVIGPGTRVVSAHGDSLLGQADIRRHREMYATLYDRLMTQLNKGMGPDDVLTQRIAREYEAEMGDASRFLDSAFRSLALAYAPD